MKGKHVFDVHSLPNLSQMVAEKAHELGCKDMLSSPSETEEDNPFSYGLLFVDLENKTIKSSNMTLSEYRNNYGLGDYGSDTMSVVEFLRLEPPPMKVALCLVITDDLGNVSEVPTLVTRDDLAKVDYRITAEHVDEAARQAKMALGIS